MNDSMGLPSKRTCTYRVFASQGASTITLTAVLTGVACTSINTIYVQSPRWRVSIRIGVKSGIPMAVSGDVPAAFSSAKSPHRCPFAFLAQTAGRDSTKRANSLYSSDALPSVIVSNFLFTKNRVHGSHRSSICCVRLVSVSPCILLNLTTHRQGAHPNHDNMTTHVSTSHRAAKTTDTICANIS